MECLPHPLGREWQLANRDTCGIENGCRNGWRHRQERALPHPLRAVRARPVGVLDRVALHSPWQVHAGRNPVVDRAEVPDTAGLVEDVVLHQRVAEAHDRGALVLAPNLKRVERLAHV